ncbi:MAG TPA: hypothetical protein VK469_01990 [Candidatus Kapabacteria bacterium]|nr:hypothetical protein [Candidatus Kapabacteria bacterium]
MKKFLLITAIAVLCIFIILVGIYIYLYVPRKVRIYEEYQQVYSTRETGGKAWGIIDNNEIRVHLEKKLGLKISKVDFDKFYLLWSDGRKIKEINYTIVSKYKWWFDHPKGEALFDEKHYLHTIFIYKIEKVIVLRESP